MLVLPEHSQPASGLAGHRHPARLAAPLPAVAADYDLDIHTYALCILAGILVAADLTNSRLTARGAEPWIIIDIGILGRRRSASSARGLPRVHPLDDYFGPGKKPDPFCRRIYIWDGGLAIFGAPARRRDRRHIGCRLTGLRFWTFADALAPALLVAQALGRLGNYFNQELFGLPTDLPWGLADRVRRTPRIPIGLRRRRCSTRLPLRDHLEPARRAHPADHVRVIGSTASALPTAARSGTGARCSAST